MLVDSDSFISVEKKLVKQGKLQKFEKETGPVTSLMMISKGRIADDMRYQLVENLAHHPLHIVYKASFDQYDETLNCIFDRQTKKPITGLWYTPQRRDFTEPPKKMVQLFICEIVNNLTDSTGIDLPIWVFINDKAHLAVTKKDLS